MDGLFDIIGEYVWASIFILSGFGFIAVVIAAIASTPTPPTRWKLPPDVSCTARCTHPRQHGDPLNTQPSTLVGRAVRDCSP